VGGEEGERERKRDIGEGKIGL